MSDTTKTEETPAAPLRSDDTDKPVTELAHVDARTAETDAKEPVNPHAHGPGSDVA